jgi:AcrR family transcriptional regulator
MTRTVKHPEVRKRELIDAARKIFCEKGYEQTSIRDILEVIGGEVGMFYHYFRSKDEIFRLSVELFLEDYICEFSALFSETVTPKQAVDKLIALVYRNITMYKKIGRKNCTGACGGYPKRDAGKHGPGS